MFTTFQLIPQIKCLTSEGSQVSKVTICVKFLKWQSVTEWPRSGIELPGQLKTWLKTHVGRLRNAIVTRVCLRTAPVACRPLPTPGKWASRSLWHGLKPRPEIWIDIENVTSSFYCCLLREYKHKGAFHIQALLKPGLLNFMSPLNQVNKSWKTESPLKNIFT